MTTPARTTPATGRIHYIGRRLLLWASLVLPLAGWLAMAWLMPTVRLASWTSLVWRGVGTNAGMTTLLFALLLFPALEEFIFRRHLLLTLVSWLQRAGSGWRLPAWCFPALANVLCSLAFSALHWPVHGVTYAGAVFVPSLVLGCIFLSYRSLPLTTAVHAYWNGLYLLFASSLI
ncbi:hypothetical protein BH11PSE7_BH11PSE7_07690 [soil metagenome]